MKQKLEKVNFSMYCKIKFDKMKTANENVLLNKTPFYHKYFHLHSPIAHGHKITFFFRKTYLKQFLIYRNI